MIHKTRGVVIRTIKYQDTGLIVHIFTEKFGMQHYLVQGARRPRAKLNANIFQPLQPLELQVYHKNNNQLQRIKEASPTAILHNLNSDVAKSTIILFLNEVLYKALKNQESDNNLFEFIYNSILWLDASEHNYSDFHLTFLIKLSKHLGFAPASTSTPDYFDLILGVFTANPPPHPHIIEPPLSVYFNQLISSNYEQAYLSGISRTERSLLVEKILEFYNNQIEGFGTVKSLEILIEIFK